MKPMGEALWLFLSMCMYVYICALTMLPFFPTLQLLGTIPFR